VTDTARLKARPDTNQSGSGLEDPGSVLTVELTND